MFRRHLPQNVVRMWPLFLTGLFGIKMSSIRLHLWKEITFISTSSTSFLQHANAFPFSRLTHHSAVLHTIQQSYTPFSSLTHHSAFLHTIQHSYTPFSSLTHHSAVLHTIQQSYTPFSILTHHSAFLHTIQQSYTPFLHFHLTH